MNDEGKTEAQLVEELAEVRQRVAELEESGARHEQEKEGLVRAEELVRQRTYELGERVKELGCLYGVSKLVLESDKPMEEILRGAASLIPPSVQYPDQACARILFRGEEFVSESFAETRWKQSASIVVSGEGAGAVEVFYLEEKPEADEGPFLREERELIEALARKLGFIVERKVAAAELRNSERELRIRDRIATVFLTVSDEEMYAEVLPIVLEAMESRFGVFGYLDEEGALVVPTMTRGIWDQCQVPDKDIVFPRDTWGDSTWPVALRERRIIHSNEPSAGIPEGHVPIRRHISLPIILEGESIGLLQVANKETDYDDEDLRLLATIGEAVAPVLKARLERDRREGELRQYRDNLEKLVKERTAELTRAQKALTRQAEEILELSTPIMRIWDRVVVAPLIGTLDSRRTQQFMERLLEAVVESRSEVALVDITGVPAIDTETSRHLIETISAVELLGSRVVLTGVRPAIAQTLVHLGVDLSGVVTRSSLMAGLRVALQTLGLEVRRKGAAPRGEA